MAALMGEEPIAAQSMFYFKPPGSKGQALHQDNYYLRVRPHTCIAAWTAVDRSVPGNGGLYVCPGTHTMEVACPEVADPEESFTTHFVRSPAGITPVPVELAPGDVLFFGGSIVHGSRPNAGPHIVRRIPIRRISSQSSIPRPAQPPASATDAEYSGGELHTRRRSLESGGLLQPGPAPRRRIRLSVSGVRSTIRADHSIVSGPWSVPRDSGIADFRNSASRCRWTACASGRVPPAPRCAGGTAQWSPRPPEVQRRRDSGSGRDGRIKADSVLP